jgi:hypothetical protein
LADEADAGGAWGAPRPRQPLDTQAVEIAATKTAAPARRSVRIPDDEPPT